MGWVSTYGIFAAKSPFTASLSSFISAEKFRRTTRFFHFNVIGNEKRPSGGTRFQNVSFHGRTIRYFAPDFPQFSSVWMALAVSNSPEHRQPLTQVPPSKECIRRYSSRGTWGAARITRRCRQTFIPWSMAAPTRIAPNIPGRNQLQTKIPTRHKINASR